MRKYILTLVAVFATFILSACGGGGSTDTTTGTTPAVPSNAVELIEAGTISYSTATTEGVTALAATEQNFSVQVWYKKNLNDNYLVKVYTDNIIINGCTIIPGSVIYDPNPLVMDKNTNSIEQLTITGKVEAGCANETDYILKGKTTVQLGDTITEEILSVNSTDVTSPTAPIDPTDPTNPDVPENGYAFFNVDTPLVISQANTDYEIKAQVVKDGLILAGKEVLMKPFNATYGDVSSYMVKTGDDGYARFAYTSPETLPANGTATSVELLFLDDNNNTITTNIELQFNTSGTGGTISQFTLIHPSTPLEVTEDGQEVEVSVYVVDASTNVGVPNKTVTITTPSLGSVNRSSVSTDDAGKATFLYTAPATITSTTETLYLRLSDNGIVSEQAITINMSPTNYHIYPENNITVSELEKIYTIDVALVQDPNSAANGKYVVAEFIMPDLGKIINYEVLVQDGVATFEYLSPERSLPTNDFNITFYYKDAPSVRAQTKVIIDPQVVDTVDKMYITPNAIKVSGAEQEYNLTILTLNAAGIGISTDVQLQQIDAKYGNFDTTKVTTDINGKAVIHYTGPNDITAVNGENVVVKATELSANISDDLNISFYTASQVKQYEIIPILPGSIPVEGIDKIGVKIVEIGTDNVIEDDSVIKVDLTSRFDNMMLFENDTTTTSYEKLGSNLGIGVKTKTLSGVAIIDITAEINDGQNNIILETSAALTIISGPITSLTLSYTGTEVDESGLYVNNYVAHATDKYSNPAREGLRITPTLINGAKLIETDIVSSGEKGEIKNGTPVTFSKTTDFSSDIVPTDRLLIVPNSADNRFEHTYLGNWSIDDIAGNILNLKETYSGENTDKLNFVIGNEERLVFRNVSTADITDPSGTYLTDVNGTLSLKLKFDPILAGHTVTVGAHVDDGNRTGVSLIDNFRWSDYTTSHVIVANDGQTHTVAITLGIGGPSPYNLIDLSILPTSILSTSIKHCPVTVLSNHTDDGGNVIVSVETDGITADQDGVDDCTISWNMEPTSILLEY